MNRRMMIKGMAAAGVAGMMSVELSAASAKPFFAAHRLPIGIQLFPLTPNLKADLRGTLRQVAKIGYRDVELAGLLGHSAREFRDALDGAGLACRCMHVPGQPVFGPAVNLDSRLDEVIADAKTLGATDIVMPLFLMPDGFETAPPTNTTDFLRAAGKKLTRANYLRIADFLNAKGTALKAHGLQLSYHNHNFEFAPQGDTFGLEIMLRQTDPKLVQFELDVGWAAAAGVDVAALLKAHPRRITKLHVKDILPATPRNFSMDQQPVTLGGGVIDWAALLPIAYAAGVRGYYVEQEAPFTGDRLQAMADNYRYLSKLKTRG